MCLIRPSVQSVNIGTVYIKEPLYVLESFHTLLLAMPGTKKLDTVHGRYTECHSRNSDVPVLLTAK